MVMSGAQCHGAIRFRLRFVSFFLTRLIHAHCEKACHCCRKNRSKTRRCTRQEGTSGQKAQRQPGPKHPHHEFRRPETDGRRRSCRTRQKGRPQDARQGCPDR
jgi:hypothetical protein